MAGKASLSDWIIVVVCLLLFGWVASQIGERMLGMDSVLAFLLFFLGLAVYFVPSLIAFRNCKKQASAIYVLNIFLGWTFLGWVVALVWACMKD